MNFWLLPSHCALRIFFGMSSYLGSTAEGLIAHAAGGEQECATLELKKPQEAWSIWVPIYKQERQIFLVRLCLLGEFYEKELYLNFSQTIGSPPLWKS